VTCRSAKGGNHADSTHHCIGHRRNCRLACRPARSGTGFGLVGDIVVGILGALIAGFLFPMLGIALTLGGGLLGAIILAFIGAVILLVIVKVIKQITA